ncbi:arginase family protein [Frigoribacterium sp. CFBP9030]|uniref:arginase family protein n=1 Tax=Frigoribacterium sp. CFBP9030 TaxID=3096537 RepID=UPI002A6A7DDF|nr:arginase family protein [Frigoribacterium sp. CFBP9030]MDY0891441.1 arginase family protein [Frigoribacterium sp. CFBP9030]
MRFVVVPQWQGSPSSRAMRLAEGAYAVLGDLPASATTLVEVPVGAGDSLGSPVHRLSSVLTVADALQQELATADSPALVVGGDCGIELGAVRHALTPSTAVVWFDAHPDLHSPRSSESGAFSGMVLRALVGDVADDLPTLDPAETPLDPSRIVLAGARTFDDAEDRYVESRRVTTISSLDLSPDDVVAAVAETGATEVYLHVDLDVLDPGTLDGLLAPQPFGIDLATLIATITALKSRFTLVGAGLCSFAPVDAASASDDMGTILRIVGALSR